MVASGRGSCNGLRQDVDTKIRCIRILDFVKERQVLPKHLTQIFFLMMLPPDFRESYISISFNLCPLLFSVTTQLRSS